MQHSQAKTFASKRCLYHYPVHSRLKIFPYRRTWEERVERISSCWPYLWLRTTVNMKAGNGIRAIALQRDRSSQSCVTWAYDIPCCIIRRTRFVRAALRVRPGSAVKCLYFSTPAMASCCYRECMAQGTSAELAPDKCSKMLKNCLHACRLCLSSVSSRK